MKCPLCGMFFEEYSYACTNCPLNKDCSLICCPNCGYKFPQESKLVNFFKRIVKKDKNHVTTGN